MARGKLSDALAPWMDARAIGRDNVARSRRNSDWKAGERHFATVDGFEISTRKGWFRIWSPVLESAGEDANGFEITIKYRTVTPAVVGFDARAAAEIVHYLRCAYGLDRSVDTKFRPIAR